MADVPDIPRPSQLWKGLPPERRQRAAEAFWKDDSASMEQTEAVLAIANRIKFRVTSVIKMPRDKKARQLVALERWTDAAILGDDAVDALVDAFAWKDALTRRRATETLVKIGSSKAVSALRTLASDPNEAVREEAKTALVALKSDSRSRQLSSSLP